MARPLMTPDPGSRIVQYVGDRMHFTLQRPQEAPVPERALLRTNLTRATHIREEVINLSGAAPSQQRTFAGESWRDIPLVATADGWELDLPLTEVGCFHAKAYYLDADGNQHWPEGEDVGINVHPDHLRTGNTIYCAFPRMFGSSKREVSTREPELDEQLNSLDQRGFTVIPPSGKLRELTACVPHILETLGCRILHLLPISPTPTTYARMGRFGSPYAQQDLTGIDPALVDFDERTTGVEQFQELAHAVHLKAGLVFLDIVVNHTGWGSHLLEQRPEWFHRNADGTFKSPGAWGVTWGDLVELDNRFPALWATVAESLLTWCRRGVDGFRCDAGYMVPLAAWQYIIARVRQVFPNATFLLEGLGGAWESTENLLTEGGMQWAYSELFQNHSPREISSYLDHCIRQSVRMGPLVHYSETHDNDRLAKQGRDWALLRNRLSALTAPNGAFGFTGGVEWLATEKIDVHQSRGMSWGDPDNLVQEISILNELLSGHPCFFDGARLQRISADDSPVLLLRRISRDGLDQCLVVVNLEKEAHKWTVSADLWAELGRPAVDLLHQPSPRAVTGPDGARTFTLRPAATFCLAPQLHPLGLSGAAYRARRAQAAWAYQALATVLGPEQLGPADWQELGAHVASDPGAFLASLATLDPAQAKLDLVAALKAAPKAYPLLVSWGTQDLNRVVCLPPAHWLYIQDPAPFSITLTMPGRPQLYLRSIPVADGFIAAVPPTLLPHNERPLDADILMERFKEARTPHPGRLRLLAVAPIFTHHAKEGLCLLTNGRGGMARLHADLGAVSSKYDCLLGVNLHPDAPCDRHILAKRMRAWVNADGFISPLDRNNLIHFEPGPPGKWVFVAAAGDGRTVQVELTVSMLGGRNAVVAHFQRPEGPPPLGTDLPQDAKVSVTVRLDLEDRGYHSETFRNEGIDLHFNTHLHPLADKQGFLFDPAPERHLRAWSNVGAWHPAPEWCQGLSHAVEGSRGMADRGDAWSPGWFQFPLERLADVSLHLSAESQDLPIPAEPERPRRHEHPFQHRDSFGRQLLSASKAFLARRGAGSTVIAGYPWFLDWGRDTFIAARGLLAGGMAEDVRSMLKTFAQFEDRGTLPNMLSADSTADRDTSDAPLWFALALEETAGILGEALYLETVPTGTSAGSRTLGEVLISIASGYLTGTPNGIQVDPESGLVWSPSHFTWMDTNYPAGTPRKGYPVEIQALWLRLLRQLERLGSPGPWSALANQATASLDLFWDEPAGHFHDLLIAPQGCGARRAQPDGLLRPNQVFLTSLGLVTGDRARKSVSAVERHLFVPGALRTLAPLPAPTPLAVMAADGRLLNDPLHPYWGRYQGSEDSHRKPAYHNGTAWVWLMPSFCEALARAWDFQPEALAAARAFLGSLDGLLAAGCIGQLPEILDGDAPHAQRGCDAQAWSATEGLRVYLLFKAYNANNPRNPDA